MPHNGYRDQMGPNRDQNGYKSKTARVGHLEGWYNPMGLPGYSMMQHVSADSPYYHVDFGKMQSLERCIHSLHSLCTLLY